MTKKIEAENITMVFHRIDATGWTGEIIINGEWAAAGTSGSAAGVSDLLWACAFYDEVGADAMYTTESGDEHE